MATAETGAHVNRALLQLHRALLLMWLPLVGLWVFLLRPASGYLALLWVVPLGLGLIRSGRRFDLASRSRGPTALGVTGNAGPVDRRGVQGGDSQPVDSCG